jgi:iron(III) transport system permease protein
VKDTTVIDSASYSRPFDGLLRAFRKNPELAVVVVVGIVIGYLSLSPTLMLFYGSFRSGPLGVAADFTLAHYRSAYTDPLTYELLFNSFVFASGSALLATVLAATLAWISIRTNAPFRKVFEITAIIPNIFPPGMLAVAWTGLLCPRRGLFTRGVREGVGGGEGRLGG